MFKFGTSPVFMADAEGSGTPAPTAAPAPAPSPTPTPEPAPAPTPTPTPAPAPSPTPEPGKADDPPAYKIPDAYKDKPWAAKIKSEDDLYKQIDTLDALKGKKQVVPDFKTATPAEIEQYYAQTRPESKDAYTFSDDTMPELKGALSESLFKNGITAVQANALIKDYESVMGEQVKGMYSAEGMNEALKQSFGDEWEKVGGTTARILKSNLNTADAALLDKMPNNTLGLIYRMANNLIKGYGITEKGAHTEAPGGNQQPADIDAKRTALRAEIAAFSTRPHTADEKQAKIDELNATYQNQGKK